MSVKPSDEDVIRGALFLIFCICFSVGIGAAIGWPFGLICFSLLFLLLAISK